MSGIRVQLPFKILDETTKSFPKCNAYGRSLLIKFRPLGEGQEPTYLNKRITVLTNYLVDDVHDGDFVGLRIRNTGNVQDNEVGISLRRLDQLKPDVVWGVLGKVVQSNARFGLPHRLEVHLDHVRMTAGNGKRAEKTKGKSVRVMSAIKMSIVVVKAAMYFLADAFLIAMARVNGDQKYKSHGNGRGMKQPAQNLLKFSGVHLCNGGGFAELEQFQEYFSDYKIIVYDGLSPDRVMFSGNSFSSKKLYLQYD